ncbi:MAG: hypothetical protein LKJ03_09535 [Enterococcaceae bacterium]|jgi:hypothetical protein|nr:hypothetical protein [Enterococcaceae bacterium]
MKTLRQKRGFSSKSVGELSNGIKCSKSQAESDARLRFFVLRKWLFLIFERQMIKILKYGFSSLSCRFFSILVRGIQGEKSKKRHVETEKIRKC